MEKSQNRFDGSSFFFNKLSMHFTGSTTFIQIQLIYLELFAYLFDPVADVNKSNVEFIQFDFTSSLNPRTGTRQSKFKQDFFFNALLIRTTMQKKTYTFPIV